MNQFEKDLIALCNYIDDIHSEVLRLWLNEI